MLEKMYKLKIYQAPLVKLALQNYWRLMQIQ